MPEPQKSLQENAAQPRQMVKCDEETISELLKRAGHSSAKSAEIALDAKRGCPFALHWIKLVTPIDGRNV